MAHVLDALSYEIPPLHNMFLLPLSGCISGLSLNAAPGEGSRSQNAGVWDRSCSHSLYHDQSRAHHVKSNASFLTFARCTSCNICDLQGMQQLAGLPAPPAAVSWLMLPHSQDVTVLWLGSGCPNNHDRRGGCSFQCGRNRSMATLWQQV